MHRFLWILAEPPVVTELDFKATLFNHKIITHDHYNVIQWKLNNKSSNI